VAGVARVGAVGLAVSAHSWHTLPSNKQHAAANALWKKPEERNTHLSHKPRTQKRGNLRLGRGGGAGACCRHRKVSCNDLSNRLPAPACRCRRPITEAASRKRAGEENSTILGPGPALADQEDDILPALEHPLDAVKILGAVHRLLVDFQNYVAAGHADVIGE